MLKMIGKWTALSVHTLRKSGGLMMLAATIVSSTAMATDPGEVVRDGIFGMSDVKAPYKQFSHGQMMGPWKVVSGNVEVVMPPSFRCPRPVATALT